MLERSSETMTIVRRIFANGWHSVAGWLAGAASILAPAVPLIGTSFLFILLDLVYGYKVYKKFSGREEFESQKFWKTVEKLMFTAIMICAFTFMDKFIFDTYETLTFAKMSAGAVCFAEFLSLLEALKALHPKQLVVRILDKVIKSKAEKYLEVQLTDVDNDTSNT